LNFYNEYYIRSKNLRIEKKGDDFRWNKYRTATDAVQPVLIGLGKEFLTD
jgi:hypothetical protein